METACSHCGKSFRCSDAPSRQAPHRYCSRACYHAARHRGIVNRTCIGCGTVFVQCTSARHQSYCSRACFLAHSTKVTKTCVDCGRTFQVYASNTHRYRRCGRGCPGKKLHAVVCAGCSQAFHTSDSRLKHCSEACRRPPVSCICLQCGKVFRISPGAKGIRRFCTFSCCRRYRGETEPERNVRLILTTLNVAFVQEYAIRRWSIDFYLPALNVALEVDSVYWHSRAVKRDKRRDNALRKMGYTVRRLPDTGLYGEAGPAMIERVCRVLRFQQQALSLLQASG